MLKSMAFTLSAITFAIGSSTAMAASTRADISISAVIPANTFHALPLNNPTFGQAETMNYNLATGTLAPLTQTYSIKSSTKSVKAYIVGGAVQRCRGSRYPSHHHPGHRSAVGRLTGSCPSRRRNHGRNPAPAGNQARRHSSVSQWHIQLQLHHRI